MANLTILSGEASIWLLNRPMTSPKASDLHEQILTHPGKKYLDALMTYSISKNILAGNGVQLRMLLELLEDSKRAMELWSVDKRTHLQDLQSEVIRHLHNFLASARTLVDHTRAIMNEPFISEAHRTEYRDEVARVFGGDPLIGFMHELRNFTLHRSIPLTSLQLSLNLSGLFDSSVLVDLDQMADWDGWRSAGKAFIGSHRPTIRIMALIDGYEGKNKGFSEWICLHSRSIMGRNWGRSWPCRSNGMAVFHSPENPYRLIPPLKFVPRRPRRSPAPKHRPSGPRSPPWRHSSTSGCRGGTACAPRRRAEWASRGGMADGPGRQGGRSNPGA